MSDTLRPFMVEMPACKLCGEAPGDPLYANLCRPCYERDDCHKCGEPLDVAGLTVCSQCVQNRPPIRGTKEDLDAVRNFFGQEAP